MITDIIFLAIGVAVGYLCPGTVSGIVAKVKAKFSQPTTPTKPA
jgi:hypothetical protein